eukprot:GEMP01051117.1.p2 GENE.GEMP01051117.1~~GEMP01051117.1.p2  ORF type:complete len:112 (+),score=8.69 GEMP01051117.1:1132-1467(+)
MDKGSGERQVLTRKVRVFNRCACARILAVFPRKRTFFQTSVLPERVSSMFFLSYKERGRSNKEIGNDKRRYGQPTKMKYMFFLTKLGRSKNNYLEIGKRPAHQTKVLAFFL